MKNFTSIIERGHGDWYVALRPELDIASQGTTVSEAKENLREALDLFFECASPEEIKERTRDDVYVTRVEMACA